MEPASSVETLAYVLKTAGISVSQLHRWQRLDLVPRKTVRRAKGYGRGTEALYPPGTADRATAVRRALAQHRSAEKATWSLWCDGTAFPEERIRRLLADELDHWEAEGIGATQRRAAELRHAAARLPRSAASRVDWRQLGETLRELLEGVTGTAWDGGQPTRSSMSPQLARKVLRRLSWGELQDIRAELRTGLEALPVLLLKTGLLPENMWLMVVLALMLMPSALRPSPRAFLVWSVFRESPLSAQVASALKELGASLSGTDASTKSGDLEVEGS